MMFQDVPRGSRNFQEVPGSFQEVLGSLLEIPTPV
jgi:hypothetical protein